MSDRPGAPLRNTHCLVGARALLLTQWPEGTLGLGHLRRTYRAAQCRGRAGTGLSAGPPQGYRGLWLVLVGTQHVPSPG